MSPKIARLVIKEFQEHGIQEQYLLTPREKEILDKSSAFISRIKPGITGLWQVMGRSDLSFNEMVMLDLFYAENWSLWSDFKIMLRTIPTILLSRGAY